MNIGIFGGSFNPPHRIHEKIAINLIESKILDKVIFVPVGNKYTKNELIDVKDRYNMLNIICSKNKNLEVSDYEMKNTLVSTYQTLDYFKKIYKDNNIYFILGSDNLKEFMTWNEYIYMLENYFVIVICRNDDNIDDIFDKYYSGYKDRFIISNMVKEAMSSTAIRKALKENNDIGLLNDNLDDGVRKYIIEHNLYQIKNKNIN